MPENDFYPSVVIPPNVYSPREVTGHIKTLFRTTDKLESELKKVGDVQSTQGLTLSEIKSDTKQIIASLSGPPPNRCVEHEMRLKAVEETTDDLEEKKQCEGCKNEPHIAVLQRELRDLREHIEILKKHVWLLSGGAAVLGTVGGWVARALIKF